jgi:large subunit ribosomal protein L25
MLKPRETGKGAARAARRDNLVPAIIYGKNTTPVAVALDAPAVKKVMTGVGIRIHHVKIEGSDFEGDVMVQDAVYDSINRNPLHFDLHKISLTEKVRTEIPVIVTGEATLEKTGLILQRQLRHISIECLPTDIPNNVSVDVANLGHGDAIAAGQVALPGNVRLVTPAAEVLVVAVAPKAAEEKPAEEAAPAEGAVAAPAAEAKPEKSENPKS